MLRYLWNLPFILFLLHLLPLIQMSAATEEDEVSTIRADHRNMASNQGKLPSIRVAHLGNSIQYYNDCPRLLANLLKRRYVQVTQDSCLRGGASLVTLSQNGNGMAQKFRTAAALRSNGTYDIGAPTVSALLSRNWDFVILNDHTQAPARVGSRANSKTALQATYLPLLGNSDGSFPTAVVFLMTAAYRTPITGSEDLGTFDEFTAKLQTGYEEYQAVIPGSRVAPVGLAYQYLYQHHPEVWEGLYANDDLHPSPHGTLLQAYVLFATITETCPPLKYSTDLWRTARYMQPPGETPLPPPTSEEAFFLRGIACQVCGVA